MYYIHVSACCTYWTASTANERRSLSLETYGVVVVVAYGLRPQRDWFKDKRESEISSGAQPDPSGEPQGLSRGACSTLYFVSSIIYCVYTYIYISICMFPIYTVYIGNIHIDIYIYMCIHQTRLRMR